MKNERFIDRHLFITQASSTEGNNATTEIIVKKWKGIAMINKDLKGLVDLDEVLVLVYLSGMANVLLFCLDSKDL